MRYLVTFLYKYGSVYLVKKPKIIHLAKLDCKMRAFMLNLLSKIIFGGTMKRTLSLFLALIMIFGALATLTSCGAPKNDGAEINIYLGAEVFDFDPSDYYVSDNAELVLALIYEPLFSVNEKGKLKLAGAKDYEVDKEERKIVITLRETYWSDNVKVRAADYVYAWCDRILATDKPNPAASLFLDVEGVQEMLRGDSTAEVGIAATEMDQITITYREGADYERLLKNLASVAASPVRQDIVETAETYWSKTANTIVTNGPFRVQSYNRDDRTFELARNLGYHQNPNVKDYDNKVRPALLYGSFTTADSGITVSYEDIKNRTVFIMADASLSDRAANKKKAETQDHTSTYTYVFNTEHPLFAEANVRLALSEAIDRDAIIEAITFGKAADGFIPDVSGGAKEKFISSEADLTKAKEYLAAANQDVVNANKAFTLTVNNDPESLKIAEIVKEAWTKLDFTVEIDAVGEYESPVNGLTVVDSEIQYLIKNASYGQRDFDVIAVDWQTYSKDASVGLASLTSNLNGMGKEQFVGDPALGTADYSEARGNVTGWSDATYDSLVEEAIKATNKKDRAAKLAEAEEYLLKAMPVCPLVFNQSFVFVGSKISKVGFDGLGNLDLTNAKLRGYTKYYKPEETEE